jgi:hypothetical protein
VIETRMLPGDTDLLALHRCFPDRYPLLLESVADGTPRCAARLRCCGIANLAR